MVVEVKYAENDGLDAECANALRQIEKKQYTRTLAEHDPGKVYKYGIASCKKHCKVVVEEE